MAPEDVWASVRHTPFLALHGASWRFIGASWRFTASRSQCVLRADIGEVGALCSATRSLLPHPQELRGEGADSRSGHVPRQAVAAM